MLEGEMHRYLVTDCEGGWLRLILTLGSCSWNQTRIRYPRRKGPCSEADHLGWQSQGSAAGASPHLIRRRSKGGLVEHGLIR